MKHLKSFLIAAALFTAVQASAQTDKETTIKLVENKNLVFNATQAYPMNSADINKVLSQMPGANSGGMISLSGSRYELTIAKDTVVAYLPYFGRAFTPSMNPNESGIKFTSTKYSYATEKKKKGNWVITIKPEDNRDIQTLTLNVTQSGYASLVVTSNNKQSITFNGYLSEPAVKKNELSK